MHYFYPNLSQHIVLIYKAAELFCLQTSNVPTFVQHALCIMTINNDNICHGRHSTLQWLAVFDQCAADCKDVLFYDIVSIHWLLSCNLWLLCWVSRRRHSHEDRLLSRILHWLLSRKWNRLVDWLFRAFWDNNHNGLLDDTRLACLLGVANLLYSLLLVQLIKKVDVHNENYPGNVTEPLSKQQEWRDIFKSLNSFHQESIFLYQRK